MRPSDKTFLSLVTGAHYQHSARKNYLGWPGTIRY